MHTGELAKNGQVSPAITRKECPAKLGVMHLQSKCFALGWKHCCILGLVKLRYIRWLTITNQCIQHRHKV